MGIPQCTGLVLFGRRQCGQAGNGNTVVDFGVDTVTENPSIYTVVEADSNGNAVAVPR